MPAEAKGAKQAAIAIASVKEGSRFDPVDMFGSQQK